ncbi:molecular chaperone [Asimina triloba]
MFCTPRHSPIRNKDIGSNGIGYPSSPIIGGSRVPFRTFEGQDELRNDIRPSRDCSHLSHYFSPSGDESAKAAEYDRQDKQGQFLEEKSRGNSEAYNESNQFHFSIYKWASKGVMLMMPAMRGNRSNAKDTSKIIPVPVEKGVNLAFPDNTTSTANNSSRFQCSGQDDVSSNGLNLVRMNKENQEAVLSEARARPSSNFDSDHTEGSEQVNKVQSGGREVHKGAEKEVQEPELKGLGSSDTAETQVHKPELKTLGSFLMCASDEPGKENIIEPTGQQDDFRRLKKLSSENAVGSGKEKISIGRKSVPKPIGRKPDLVQAETTKSNLLVAPLNSDYNMQGNRTKGKVKEFVKIFNQESSPKLTRDFDTTSHSSRRKESGLSKNEDTTTKAYRREKANNQDNIGTLTDTPSMADQIPKLTAKIHPVVKANDRKVCDSSSERNDTSDSSPGSLNDALENIEDSHCEELHVSCLRRKLSGSASLLSKEFHAKAHLEQLPEDEKESLHLQPNQDDIQIIDAKIRQWSHAKEENIRSLLSTLQYVTSPDCQSIPGAVKHHLTGNASEVVLWPESGWKPVPLVDIIEGSSVRRAYQKALLCLHPDKLQQRGAAVHQNSSMLRYSYMSVMGDLNI